MSSMPPIALIAASGADLSTMDYVDAYQHDTALMHNTLIRAFNGIVAQALKVLPSEMESFACYVDAFCETLRRHCEGENTVIFPRIATHVPLNGADNQAVLRRLIRVEEWTRDAIQTPEKADPIELMAAMEIMAPAFEENMHGQVKLMTASALASCISGPELRGLVNDDLAWIAQNSRMEYLLPFITLHHDRSTNEIWPGLPDEAKNVLPALIESHAEAWNFAPFDLSGRPRSF